MSTIGNTNLGPTLESDPESLNRTRVGLGSG